MQTRGRRKQAPGPRPVSGEGGKAPGARGSMTSPGNRNKSGEIQAGRKRDVLAGTASVRQDAVPGPGVSASIPHTGDAGTSAAEALGAAPPEG